MRQSETTNPHTNMTHVKVFDYKSGEPLGHGTMPDEKFAEYEASLDQNPTGAVRLDAWLSKSGREDVIAQDDTTVYFDEIQMKSAE